MVCPCSKALLHLFLFKTNAHAVVATYCLFVTKDNERKLKQITEVNFKFLKEISKNCIRVFRSNISSKKYITRLKNDYVTCSTYRLSSTTSWNKMCWQKWHVIGICVEFGWEGASMAEKMQPLIKSTFRRVHSYSCTWTNNLHAIV